MRIKPDLSSVWSGCVGWRGWVLKFLAVHPETGDMVRRLGRNRIAERLGGGLAQAAAALWLAAAPLSAAAGDELLLSEVRGLVEIGGGSPPAWREAQSGDALAAGDVVRTGPDGFAELHTAVGTVRMFPSSVLRLPESFARAPERMDLDAGTSVFDILKRPGQQSFEVHSPTAVVMVKGTRFSVSAHPVRAVVAVSRGLVSVRGSGAGADHEVLVRPGFAALGGAEAPFALRLVDVDADGWEAWSRGELSAPPAAHPAASAELDVRHAAQAAAALAADQKLERLAPPPAAADGAPARAAVDAAASRARAAGVDVLDARSSGEVRSEMREAFTAAALNGPNRAGADSAVSVEFVSGQGGPGSDRVQITGAGLDQGLTRAQVEQALHGNSQALGPELLGLLQGRGVDPVAFASQLDAMFRR
jgi:hypothetical protein